MTNLTPINQINLFGLNRYFDELIFLHQKKCLPSKILLSGQKGIGKSTLVFHLMNSYFDPENYDLFNNKILLNFNFFDYVLLLLIMVSIFVGLVNYGRQ